MEYIDFKKHLQELLDEIQEGLFVVSNTRDMVGKTDKINVVVTALQGTIQNDSASIPYQVEIFSDDPDTIINVFTGLATKTNGKSFDYFNEQEKKSFTIFEFYGTPSVIEKDVEYGVYRFTRLILFVSLNILFEVGNVKSLKIDGEDVKLSSGTLTYQIEPMPNRVSGKQLNYTTKKTATTGLSFQMVNKTSIFTRKLFMIMFGLLDGNTIFECEITLTNGIKGTLPMIINANTFSFAKESPNLPSLNVSLIFGKEE